MLLVEKADLLFLDAEHFNNHGSMTDRPTDNQQTDMREGSYTSNKLCPFYNCLSSVRQILTKFSLVIETEYM